MSQFEQAAWTRPETAGRSGSRTEGITRGATSFLLAGDSDVRRDSRRIVIGLALLAGIAVVLVNVAIYQASHNALLRDRWSQLTRWCETARDEVRESIQDFTREAGYVAGQPRVHELLVAASSGPLAPPAREALENELERAAETFGFEHVAVRAADGSLRASTRGSRSADDLSAALASPGEPVAVRRGSGGPPHVAITLPFEGGAGATVTFEAPLEARLGGMLRVPVGLPRSAGAYLVRKSDGTVEYLTQPTGEVGFSAGDRVPVNHVRARPAAMAVEGVEAATFVDDADEAPEAVVSRFLPEYGWGLIVQVDRTPLMAGMEETLLGLLVLDVAMVMLVVAGLWLWRRQYATGLAQRETEVTRRHAERVQSIFDTAFDAILVFDRDGRIRSANRAAEELLARPASELEGERIHRFLAIGDDGRVRTELPTPGTVYRGEVLRADGVPIPFEGSIGRVGEGDDLLHTAIVRDIRDRVEADRQIREIAEGLEISNRRLEELNAQLEEASRLKSEFLANTSHELRTPLNGMIGFLQLVLDGMCDSAEEEREFQRQALQCSRHLLGLINDVLDIAKIEAGKLALEIEAVAPSQLFDEVYTLTHVQAAQKGIQLRLEPPADGDLRVRGDFGKVKQVLINLVGNSLKFTHKGSVTVRAIGHPELGYVMFEVVDTGIGIPRERQKLIFEKFVQGDGSTTRRYGGTGLGLAITRSLVELMGGIIGVHSDGEGHGTRLYFALPLWREEGEDGAVPDEVTDRIAGPAGGALVLVVEDDRVFRRFLTALLHQHGYRTVESRDAEGAWVLARRLRPSVVVLDYALTCAESATLRSGWDLAERMTTDAKTRHIPLVFVTGFDAELKDKLKSTAFARKPEHLVKPVEGSVLVSKIEELCGAIEGRIVRVLMADDDPSVAAYIRKVLPEERFHIEVTTDGEECLHVLRTQPRGYDLLLLDLMMPGVSGYDVLREMTLANLATELPVLVLTNFPAPRSDEEKRLLEQGLVLDVLPKTAVHDNPQLLPHIIDWHMHVVTGEAPATPPPGHAERKAA